MKHTLLRSLVLSVALIGGTAFAPDKKAASKPLGQRIKGSIGLGQALEKLKKDKNQAAFDLVVDALYESYRPVGSKRSEAGDWAIKNLCVKAIERAHDDAIRMGFTKTQADAFAAESTKKCGVATRTPSGPITPPPGGFKKLDNTVVNTLNTALTNLKKETDPTVFDTIKNDAMNVISTYKGGDYKDLSSTDKATIDNLENAISLVPKPTGTTKTDWTKVAKGEFVKELKTISVDNLGLITDPTQPKADAEALYTHMVAGYNAAKLAKVDDLDLADAVGDINLIVDIHGLDQTKFPKLV